MSGAAILLFGKKPQRFFQRARVRFIKYEGTEAKVGAEMNVVKDIPFEGRILDLVEKTLDFVKGQIKERTYLGEHGRFTTVPEYAESIRLYVNFKIIPILPYTNKKTD